MILGRGSPRSVFTVSRLGKSLFESNLWLEPQLAPARVGGSIVICCHQLKISKHSDSMSV